MTVYTDHANAYQGMPFDHHSMNRSVGEYVRGVAHTNGIESFWSTPKRGYVGGLLQALAEAPGPVREGVRRPTQCAEL